MAVKLTSKQQDLLTTFIDEGKPFQLSVRRSFARSNSNTIDIKRGKIRRTLKEIHVRRYENSEDVKEKTKEAVKMIVSEIESRCGGIFEGVEYLTEEQDGSS